MNKGFVALVGAGPGELGLLTLRGKELLEQADVVVYDRLVSQEILSLIPKTAKAVNVGKQSSNHLVAQQDINKILLHEALDGHVVVRLKGGDPFVFGRGGEELELLVAHQVAFEVVPGITSAIGAATFAGIPLTHRDFCSSLHIITGHQRESMPLQIDFEALVRTKGTLVFLMGVSALQDIVSGLIQAGMSSDMPCALVENGTRPIQRKVVGSLGDICQRAKAEKIVSPAIILVGQVCSLSQDYDWFSKRPLFGRSVVVTRPLDKAGTLAQKLRQLGAMVVEAPCIAIKPPESKTTLHQLFNQIKSYSWLVFTSQNGVEQFMEQLLSQGQDCRALQGVKLAALGSQTAKALRNYGLLADFMPGVFSGIELAKGLIEQLSPTDKLCLLRAKQGNQEIVNAFVVNNISFTNVPVYETVFGEQVQPALMNLLQGEEKIIVTFTSGSTVDGFINAVKGIDLTSIFGICIGQLTAKKAQEAGIPHVIAPTATIEGMIETILEVCSNEQ